MMNRILALEKEVRLIKRQNLYAQVVPEDDRLEEAMVDAKTLGLAETYKHLGQALAAAESALVAALGPGRSPAIERRRGPACSGRPFGRSGPRRL